MKVKDVGFGETLYGTNDLESLIPATLPKVSNAWKNIAEQWFKTGLKKESVLVPVPGIIKENAIKHIMCLFNTWDLNKKQKIDNAAYLLSQWFTHINI